MKSKNSADISRSQRTFGLFALILLAGCEAATPGDADMTPDTQAGDPLTTAADHPVLPAEPLVYADSEVNLPPHIAGAEAADADNTPISNPISNAGATLGRVLFYDKRLSVNDRVSCASCHQQAHGFADPDRLSRGFQDGETARHSMGLSNARYYARGRFFWDERAATLEDQVLMPIQDPVEMGMDLTQLEAKLSATDYYPPLFEAAFGSPEIDRTRIARALAQFVRAMTSYRAKFDQAFAGGGPPDFAGTFTAQELRGQQLFMGQGGPMQGLGCVRCHGGNAQISDNVHNTGLDAVTIDEGAGNARFKSPSLRNVEMRPPYMHDGRFATLEEVVEHYNSGVQAHPDLDPRLRDRNGNPLRLNLDPADKAALVAFLTTLTDFELMRDERFSDPFTNAP